MNAKAYDLDFKGYWREPNIGGLPAESGVYGVYCATHDKSTDQVTLNRLIYIGESGDVRKRVDGHEKLPEWKRQLRHDEQLCFNAALISPAADRERAEAAMIYRHKPVCNDQYKYTFPFDSTTITTRGRNALMADRFTVHRTHEAR